MGGIFAHHRPEASADEDRVMNLVYSMKRLVQLIVRDMKTSFRAACVTNMVGHPLWHKTGEIKLERSVSAFSQRGNQVAS